MALIALPAAAQTQQAPEVDTGSSEIVVTATRTESTINKVPISIQAFSKAALDVRGVRLVEDIFRLTPGVTFTRGLTGQTAISIRGIASASGAATTGIYVDDSPIQTRTIGFQPTTVYPVPFDLERVEVLRGPQGTLYGAGSEGGTVRFITPRPSLAKASVYSRAELSTTEGGDRSYEAGIAGNVPINDKIAVRLMAYHRRDGGYVDHVQRTTGIVRDKNSDWQDTTAVRAAILFQPTPELKIVPSIYYQHIYQNDQQAAMAYVSNVDKKIFINNANANGPFNSHWRLPSLNIAYDTEKFSVTANSAYFYQNNYIDRDYSDFIVQLLGGRTTPATGISGNPDYVQPARFTNFQKYWSNEIRVTTHLGGWFDMTAGLFYQKQKQEATQNLREISQASFDQIVLANTGRTSAVFFPNNPLLREDGNLYSYQSLLAADESQKAVFGEATIKPFDHVKIILGARYSLTNFTYDTTGRGPYGFTPTTSARGTQREKPFTPKLGVEYELNANNRVYFTASKGFRPGGANAALNAICGRDLANLGLNTAPTSYNSDSVWSYEVGSKNKLFANKLSVNLSGYRVDWKGIQQSILLPICGSTFVANANSAVSKGFDVDLEVRPARGLLLQFAAGYNKSVFTEPLLTAPTAAGTRLTVISRGNTLGNSPVTVTGAAQYDWEVNDRLGAYVRGDMQYLGKETRDTATRDPRNTGYVATNFPLPSQYYATARVGLRTESIDISLFVNNIFNDTPPLQPLQFGPRANLIAVYRVPRPRTIGLTMTYRD